MKEQRIQEAYKMYFNDEIEFTSLVAMINIIYNQFTNRKVIFYLTPLTQSRFYSNVFDNLYSRRKKL